MFYISINGQARKIKKMYIGVDGKARKVKYGYFGADQTNIFKDGKLSSNFPLISSVYNSQQVTYSGAYINTNTKAITLTNRYYTVAQTLPNGQVYPILCSFTPYALIGPINMTNLSSIKLTYTGSITVGYGSGVDTTLTSSTTGTGGEITLNVSGVTGNQY